MIISIITRTQFIVHYRSGLANFIEAAIYSLGISDKQLTNNVARLLKEKLLGESD